ncbi:MAG: DUF3575 domain-containing protein [Raineya sp.]|jgi:hypothetical protein|nr:DUF3575 domain-containing protein [Raineya sp.]
MKNVLRVLSFICLCSYSTYSQTDTSSRIRVYTPSGNNTSNYNSEDSYKWAIKTDLVPMFSGEFPIIGEFKVSKRFSTEFSAGVTYGFIPTDVLNDDLNTVPDGFSNPEADNPGTSTAFRLAFKYYPSKYESAIEGWFVGLQLLNKSFVRNYTTDSDPLLLNEKFKRSRVGATIIFGKQVVWDSNVFSEFFFGVGIARVNYAIPAINDINNTLKIVNNSRVLPNILIGYRFGFGN